MTNQVNNKSDSGILRALKATASLKVTVVCLVLLALLVVWGTLYQAENGLYQAQQKFFHSWFFFIFGFIPFPGTVMVMFVLFINLVTSLFFRIGFRLSNLGNIITHTGIIILFVGGFFTFYYSEESSLMMKEGETAAMSSSYNQWELAVWERTGAEKIVYAVETGNLDEGESIGLDDLNMELQVLEYYANCTAFTGSSMDGSQVINSSGIKVLKEKTPSAEAGENVAGLVLAFNAASDATPRVLLYGRDSVPTPVSVNNRSYYFSLRKKKVPLPLTMTLLDFNMTLYPNSGIPKSYESKVSIKTEDGMERDVLISMNKPLRYKDLTFFQSSYYIAPDGTEYTVLAVVKNFGRLLPYISSLWIFLGLIIHFIVRLLRSRKKTGVLTGNEG